MIAALGNPSNFVKTKKNKHKQVHLLRDNNKSIKGAFVQRAFQRGRAESGIRVWHVVDAITRTLGRGNGLI